MGLRCSRRLWRIRADNAPGRRVLRRHRGFSRSYQPFSAAILAYRMEDGSTKVFQGYRVQYHLSMGPTKGGTRFAGTVTIGEIAALDRYAERNGLTIQ